MDEEAIQQLYSWIDEITLSRPKRNITRDFSDGGKVFKRIDFNVPSNIVSGIVMCKPGVIEIVLYNLRVKILNYKKNTEGDSEFSDAVTDPEPWSGNTGNPAVAVPVASVPPQYYNPERSTDKVVFYPKVRWFIQKKGCLSKNKVPLSKRRRFIQKWGGLSKRKDYMT
eukprot:sb/3472369/